MGNWQLGARWLALGRRSRIAGKRWLTQQGLHQSKHRREDAASG